MISIQDNKDCCGCAACVQRCPKLCITMHEDEEGFLYPEVDREKCIDCGLCEKVCPVINQGTEREPLEVFAAINPNEEVRMQSSSGGVFSMLAESVIDEGGVVFGACFDERWEVVHCYVEDKDSLAKFRGSKYVQSKTGETYKQAEAFLKDGRKVLYSGTPCQIAGLKRYLRKDYDNLLAVDFICHGVPSPGVFRTYLQGEINKAFARKGEKNTVLLPSIPLISERDGLNLHGMVIESISFRDKRKGWKKFGFALKLSKASAAGEENSVSLSYESLNKNLFLRGFLKNLFLRPSCYACKVRGFRSESDITIADFWGIGKLKHVIDDDKGCSMLIINSKKGNKLCNTINMKKIHCSSNVVRRYNPAAYYSCNEPVERRMFFTMNLSIHDRIKRLARPTIKEIIHLFLKTIIRDYLKIRN